MEVLKVVKLDSEKYKLILAACACAGYEGYCASLVEQQKEIQQSRWQTPAAQPAPPPVIRVGL